MTDHTPTPWRYDGGKVVADVADPWGRMVIGATVAKAHREPECPIYPAVRDDNMKRIVACVNACEGLSTEALRETSLAGCLEAVILVFEGLADEATRPEAA